MSSMMSDQHKVLYRHKAEMKRTHRSSILYISEKCGIHLFFRPHYTLIPFNINQINVKVIKLVNNVHLYTAYIPAVL